MMKKILILIYGWLKYLPLILFYLLLDSNKKEIVKEDIIRWISFRPQYELSEKKLLVAFVFLITLKIEFRIQFFTRIGGLSGLMLKKFMVKI